jgi:hypothetical protein
MTAETNPDFVSRTLIYIRIIHSQVDMGAFSNSLRRVALEKFGEAAWKRKVNRIEEMWKETEKFIQSLSLSYEKVRLYQDGLPVCGREDEIVSEVARAGGWNYRLLLHLMKKGATIMGTESPELLVEEYELMKEVLAEGDASREDRNEPQPKALSESLLERRDQFMADRIHSTLQSGETGILFLGMLHSLEKRLPKDMQVVIYPPNQIPNGRGGR